MGRFRQWVSGVAVFSVLLAGCTGESDSKSSAEASSIDSEGAGAGRSFSGPYNSVVSDAAGEKDSGFTRERVHFITNRRPGTDDAGPNEYFTLDSGSLIFGSCDVSIPYTRDPATLPEPGFVEDLLFGENPKKHIVLLKIDLFERPDFVARLRENLEDSDSSDILLFIHGYRNTFRAAARRTAQLAYDLNFKGQAVFFSWPAGRTNYLGDLRKAEASIDECVEALKLLAGESGATRIHIVAHSMGNFVLTRALQRLSESGDGEVTGMIHHIALAAPDISAEQFRTEIAPQIKEMAGRYTVYASRSDWAMDASREANDWNPLGDINAESVLAGQLAYVDFIDATAVSSDSWFSVNHAYYGDMPELISDVRSLFRGVPAMDRRLESNGATYRLKKRVAP